MSLRFAILGLLARESLTGYDLTKRFDSSVGFFWSAKHSQIYPELAALTKEGLVTFELVAQTSKPNKKVYTITDDGRAALAEWVAHDGPDRRSVKDPLVMRVWSLGAVDPALVVGHLQTALGEYEAREAHYEATDKMLKSLSADQAGNPWHGVYMAMRAGQMQNAAYLEWLRWSLKDQDQP